VIRDLEFVQFHPTVLWLPGASGQCPLITEALRGAGAVLRDVDGTPLMAGHDPRGDLAPRDVVAARMAEAIAAGDAGHVWLDATELGRDLLEDGFPTVSTACRKHGIDPVTEMIPVAPGAHYSCGGILADLDGRTSLPGLYAVGEAASTGVQGANRLASNSVTEAIIAGRRTGAAIADALARADCPGGTQGQERSGLGAPETSEAVGLGHTGPANSSSGAHRSGSLGLGAHKARVFRSDVTQGQNGAGVYRDAVADRYALAQAMSRYAGVMRDGDGLARLLAVIAEAGTPCALGPAAGLGGAGRGDEGRGDGGLGDGGLGGAALAGAGEPGGLDLESVEAANLRAVSVLIAVGARRRAESRGCHRRLDAVDTDGTPWHTLARWDGQKLLVTREEL
jgi:L-aspartate oxidase